ncbi:MAG: hypothetical protein HPY69_00675 [Armatimonadetes bacterium]|nr:hypothetical protein [Armatimonadota bacterium]
MRAYVLIAVSMLCLLISVAAWAEASHAVPVGKDSQGRTVYLQVIPLKYMDPALAAIMFGGTVIGAGGAVGDSPYGGSYGDRGYMRRGSGSWGQSYQGDWGYGGYSPRRGDYGTPWGYPLPQPFR